MPFEFPRPEHLLDSPDVAYRKEQLTESLLQREQQSDGDSEQELSRLLSEVQNNTDEQNEPILRERLATRIAVDLINGVNTLGLPDKAGEAHVREDQIASIAALLEGVSLHAPTGSGKTSVVIPIAAIAGAFAASRPILVETVSPELVATLQEQIGALAERLPQQVRDHFKLLAFVESQSDAGISKSDQVASLAKGLIEANTAASGLEIPPAIAAEQRKSLFSKFLNGTPDQFVDPRTRTQHETLSQDPTVIVAQEGSSRFYTMRNPGAVSSVIADEADVPFNRNAEYVTTIEPGVITPEAVETYCTDRLLAGIVATLIDEAPDDSERVFDTLSDTDGPEFKAALHQIAHSVSEKLNVDPGDLKNWFMHRIITVQTAQMALGGSLQDVFSAHYLACLQARELSEGSHYSLDGDKNPAVRDHFMGLQLPSHQFQYQLTLALQAQHDAFDYKSPDVAERDASSYQGAITNSLKGNYVGLSGTFFSRELASDAIVPGSFARFVERVTDKEPVSFITETHKAVPKPEIASSRNIDEILMRETSDTRQILVACFNESDGRRLQHELTQKHPERVCFLISDTLTESESARLMQDFADTPGALLVSTGRIGVGVDILTSGGLHTDHKTVVYGIPFSQSQIFQALGRRRLEGNTETDASWIIDLDTISQHPYIQTLDEQQMSHLERKLLSHPLPAIDDLIRHGVEGARTSDERHLQIDRAYTIARAQFEQKIRTRLPHLITDIFADDAEGQVILSRFLDDIKNARLEGYAESMLGCPSGLYWQVKRQLSGYAGYGNSAYGRLIESLDTTVASDDAVDEWIETKQDEIGYILKKILLETIRESLDETNDGSGYQFVSLARVPKERCPDVEGVIIEMIPDPQTSEPVPHCVLMGAGNQIRFLQETDRMVPINVDTGPLSLGILYSDNPENLDTEIQT